MDDLDRTIAERALCDAEFVEGYEPGFQAFKLGVMLKAARESAGLTQAEVAHRLGTHKSAISRMENHAADIRVTTLQRFAEAVGCLLSLELRPAAEGRIPTVVREYQASLLAEERGRTRASVVKTT